MTMARMQTTHRRWLGALAFLAALGFAAGASTVPTVTAASS
jgi:hypothetical protein